MKKIFLMLVLLATSVMVHAQGYWKPTPKIEKVTIPDGHFDFKQFMEEADGFNLITGGSRARAKGIMKLNKMSDDGAIQWQYVIKPKNERDSIDAEKFFSVIDKWKERTFLRDNVVKNKDEKSIEFEYSAPKVADVEGYLSFSIINAIKNLKIELKENRFRVTLLVRHYQLITMNGNKLHNPKDCYPFEDTSNKSSFSMAFVNCNVRTVNRLHDLFTYINENYGKIEVVQKKEDVW